MNKNLIAAVAALTLTTSALADISISGNYEGTISDGNPGAATYSQELDLAIVGKAELATVTAKVKNVDAGDNITFNEVYFLISKVKRGCNSLFFWDILRGGVIEILPNMKKISKTRNEILMLKNNCE